MPEKMERLDNGNVKNQLTMAEVKLRKQKLQDDLDLLEKGFQSRVSRVRSGIPDSLSPVSCIRKKPFTAIGLALIAGMAAGLVPGKKRASGGTSGSVNPAGSSGFSSILISELKRIAARRTADYLSELLEQKLSEKK